MIAYSSEVYEIETKDIAILPDGIDNDVKAKDDIIIKIGDNFDYHKRNLSQDVLIKGRRKVQNALRRHQKYVKVRIAFTPKNKWFDIISPIIRIFRYRIRAYCSNSYHISPQFIRKKHLERNIRTAENAYEFSNPHYKMSEYDRKKTYGKLYKSMQKRGFDDKYPLDIMLCRNMGVKDTLNQGHHRMSVAMELGLKRVSVIFSSAGAAPRFLRAFLMKIAKLNMFFKR